MFLLFIHLRSFKKFKFQIFGTSNVVFLDKKISNKKLSTIKFYNFLRSTTFILVVSPSVDIR